MSRFEVDTEEVARAASAAGRSATAINAEVANMFRILSTLQSAWRGSASTAFAALAQEWRGTQQQVEANLQRISEALASSAQHYSDVEHSTTHLFRT